MVDLATFDDVLRFLVNLIADRLRIVSGCGNEKVQRLHSCVTGAFRHDIKQLPVWLSMQLIKHHTVGIETVLVADVSGKNLIDTARGDVDQPFLRFQNLDPFR